MPLPKPVKGQSFRALTLRGALLLPFGYLCIDRRAKTVKLDCSPSSGDTTSKSLTVSHVTLLVRPSIRKYPNGRRRAPLVTLRGALLLPFGYLRIDGRAKKVTWDTGNHSQVVSPDEGKQEGEEEEKRTKGSTCPCPSPSRGNRSDEEEKYEEEEEEEKDEEEEEKN